MSHEEFSVFVTVYFQNRKLDGRKFTYRFDIAHLEQHMEDVLSRKAFVPPVYTYRLTRWDREFEEYEDIDNNIGAIEHKDKIAIYIEPEDTSEPRQSGASQAVVNDHWDDDDDEGTSSRNNDAIASPVPTPPVSATPPVPTPAPSTHEQFGYTMETVPEEYQLYLFNDSEAFDVDEAISRSRNPQKLVASFTEHNFKNEPNFEPIKKDMIHAIGDYLIARAVRKGRKAPEPIDRAKMAFSLWLKYPWYGSSIESSPLPWTKTFDPVSHRGPLEFYIVRQTKPTHSGAASASSARKKSKGPPRKAAKLDVELDEEQIQVYLRTLKRESANSPASIEAMEQLASYRRNTIRDSDHMTPQLILDIYPPFLRTPELIFEDYLLESESSLSAEQCEGHWESAVPFLLKEAMAKQKPTGVQKTVTQAYNVRTAQDLPTLLQEEQSRLGLMLLPCLLTPSIQSTKKGKSIDKLPILTAISHLIQCKSCGPGMDINEAVRACKSDMDLTQPFLLAITQEGKWGEDVQQMFLVINFKPIEVPVRISCALRILFASFYTFNIDFPKGLKQVYAFLQKLYGLKPDGSGGRADDLYDRMMAVLYK